jgi:hypothetical protein
VLQRVNSSDTPQRQVHPAVEIWYGFNGMLKLIVKFLCEAALKGGIWSAKVVRIADDIAEES